MISLLPHPCRVLCVVAESLETRTLVLRPEPPAPALATALPGQFVMLSLLGVGEAAFTLSSLRDAARGTATVTVRRVGTLTTALCALTAGGRVGLRGPFGRGFPPPDPMLPTVYVAGGCGLAPLRPAVEAHVARAPRVPLAILYGARVPEDRIFGDDLARWRATPAVRMLECVERPDAGWRGAVGTVGDHLAEAVGRAGARRAVVCGPPAMLADAARRLGALGLPPTAIHLALERYMKCGVGLCGHCYVGARYVCTDGPVFSLAELERVPDAFAAEAAAAAAAAAC
jgi:NAD(P)H-flavin reductase